MDGRGGCCIARYGGGAYDISKMSEAGSRSGRERRRFNSTNGNLSEEKVDAVVTLPLLPETPDCKDTPGRETPVQLLSPKQAESLPTWLSFGRNKDTGNRR
uniref:Uncharacterized protein n=1 Tax=Manihot esculenta TaxID=3983 RepID=A0A2C9WJV8_MANES